MTFDLLHDNYISKKLCTEIYIMFGVNYSIQINQTPLNQV